MNRRMSQRDILPLAVKFRLSEYYDPKENTINFKDDDGTSVFKIELDNGTVTFGTNVKFSAAITKGITPSSFVKEIQIPLMMAGQAGGGFASYYTNQHANAQYLWPSRFNIDPDDYPGCTFLLEAVYRAGVGGAEPSRTFNMDLYDIDATAVVTDSEISGSEQSGSDPAGYPILTGTTDFRENMTSGKRDYVLTYIKSDNTDAADFIDLYEARLIIRF